MADSCHGEKQRWLWWLTGREAGENVRQCETSGNGVNMEKGENLNSIPGSSARPFWLGSTCLQNKKQPRTQNQYSCTSTTTETNIWHCKDRTARINIYKNLCSRSHKGQSRQMPKSLQKETKTQNSQHHPKEVKCSYYSYTHKFYFCCWKGFF